MDNADSMKSPRFFHAGILKTGEAVQLSRDTAHHIRVRRLRPGQLLTLFDGQGMEASARLETIARHEAQVQVLSITPCNRELPGQITVVQAIAAQDKLDFVLEKATELGVHRLIVCAAQRSVVRLDQERAQRRAEHARRIVESASAQCGRNHLMQVEMPVTLDNALAMCEDTPKLALLPGADSLPLNDRALLASILANQACAIFIGPEGGWDTKEVQQLTGAGAQACGLGPRVLRTETAALAAVSALSALTGWTWA